ncbi:MAG: hypothetical protein AB7J32_11100 [Pseudonocardia sp.]
MPPEIIVSTHVHIDGPIPGPHSLLTLAAAAHVDGGPTAEHVTEFAATLRELPGATPHPTTLQDWRSRPEEWLRTRRGSRPPALVAADLLRWVESLPGVPVLATDHGPDHLFLYWYLQRFTGRWPFDRVSVDPAHRTDAAGTCVLDGCRAGLVRAA